MKKKFSKVEDIDSLVASFTVDKRQKSMPEMSVIDNYIQIGPNSMIEAGTKQKEKKKTEVFEILDSEEIDKDIQKL
jgi:hypothetical protein